MSEQNLREHGGFHGFRMPEPCETVMTDVVRVAMAMCRLTSINEYDGFMRHQCIERLGAINTRRRTFLEVYGVQKAVRSKQTLVYF